MDNRLTTKEFLRVFDFIRSSGEKADHEYQLGELHAWHDYDGYTCWLRYKDVTVALMFHSSLKIEYDKSSSYTDFVEHCLTLTASKTTG